MSRLLDMLVDEVGDDESHALAGLVELVAIWSSSMKPPRYRCRTCLPGRCCVS